LRILTIKYSLYPKMLAFLCFIKVKRLQHGRCSFSSKTQRNAAVLWNIWKNRNNKVFKRTRFPLPACCGGLMLWACRTQDLGGIKLPVGSHPFTGKSGPPPEGRVTVAQHFQAQDKRCVGDSASPTPESVRVGRLPTHGALHWDRLEA
jgi:hypothetical protein